MTDTMIERVARAICRANVLSMMKVAGLKYHELTIDAEVERLYRDDLPGAHAAIVAIKAETPSAWMHPTAGWAHADREQVEMHCFRGKEAPIPLYAIDAALQETKG